LIDTGHVVHAAAPTNPKTGEIEDTDVGFPGPDHHIADQTPSMKLAMGVLAFLALFAGFIQVPGVDETVTHFLDPVFADSPLAAIHPSNSAAWFGLLIGGLISLAGIGIAYWLYVASPETPRRLQERFSGVHTFLYNKWYFDEAIDFLIVRPALGIGRFANRIFERYVIDGAITGGTEETVGRAGAIVRTFQNGIVRTYGLFLVAGAVGLALYFLIHQS
jgi:NADH-quinone oxidoreductase subunit L